MKITKRWLKLEGACLEGIEWVVENCKDGEAVDVINTLMADNKFDWANWLIVRVMTRPQYLQYAIFVAEQVIDIFEKKYPNDKRPRTAIEAAKKVLKNDTTETRAAAWDARAAAWDARDAAWDAAWDAQGTAWAAARAARAAAGAALAAARAARDVRAALAAAGAAWDALAAAQKKMQKRIINYGVSLIKEMN